MNAVSHACAASGMQITTYLRPLRVKSDHRIIFSEGRLCDAELHAA